MYEYVKKSEYLPIKKQLEKIIRKVQVEMSNSNDLPFEYQLIGSGNRHLVTRIVDGNAGFDFDYNLIIAPPDEGWSYRPDVIKEQFMDAFKHALKGTQYSNPKNSTSVITIKVVDRENKKLRYGCDFAIIYWGENDGVPGYWYLRNNKDQSHYEFAFRAMRSNYRDKLDEILEEYDWIVIREEYLKLKNINEGNSKPSFCLFIEAVNNVYNQFFLQD